MTVVRQSTPRQFAPAEYVFAKLAISPTTPSSACKNHALPTPPVKHLVMLTRFVLLETADASSVITLTKQDNACQ